MNLTTDLKSIKMTNTNLNPRPQSRARPTGTSNAPRIRPHKTLKSKGKLANNSVMTNFIWLQS